MRAIRCLTLLLALFAPAAFAEGAYQVEMILVRQNAVPAITSQFAPEDWSNGAQAPAEGDMRQPSMTDQAARLAADPSQYTILLHKAWQQEAGAVAISEGQEQFGQFPIEGNLSVTEDRFIAVDASFWVNQFDSNGSVIQSEQLKQSNSTVKNGELTFLDGGHLALLLKVTANRPASAPTPAPEMMEQ
ncbi:peptidoglycan binding protein CsiV [Pseudomonas sp. GD03860]|uniref:CsiV family protein n=1 Tax=Pseudomonas TaxID=286 RepID=UPI002363EB2E|nr:MULTISPECIES: CsiV family protein [Pseudomonas]MDD2056210.1 peptidoglycan binding protein CsiV [Pseudomonas putida]MDH0637357.1 peptidoglycan binding protein CsiV [Pseudomonas sp. GD03860]